MVDRVGGLPSGVTPELGSAGALAQGRANAAGRPAPGERFGAVLARSEETPLTFSGHAARRMEQRGVQLDEDHMRRLQAAVGRAEAKGSRDSLILLDDLALVVSIQNHTVVTAVDEANQKEHVFTNIDSVVIAE
jgi:flagellar operon protein